MEPVKTQEKEHIKSEVIHNKTEEIPQQHHKKTEEIPQ